MRQILALAIALALAPISAPLAQTAANPQISAISQRLRLPETFEIIAAEALVSGEDLRRDLMPARDAARWRESVAQLHSPSRLQAIFAPAFEQALEKADKNAIAQLLDSPVMRRALDLELATRRALLDPETEETALALAASERASPRMRLVQDHVKSLDLIERNVQGALNANYGFYRAMVAQTAPEALDEAALLADVTAQSEEIRAQMESWLEGYLFAAYHSLSDAELAAYNALGETEAGQALSAALFAGFEAVFVETSRALGALVGGEISAQSL